jgi:hypothetical protein
VQRERGLARAFRPVDLDDAALGQAADAERDVEAERAGGDRLDVRRLRLLAPIFMIEPLPKARSIWLSAASSAFPFSILDIPLEEGLPPTATSDCRSGTFYRLGRGASPTECRG